MTPEEQIQAFLLFRDECIWSRCCFNTYATLFEDDSDTLVLLHKTASIFFHDFNEIIVDYCLLQMCKLTDPARTCGKNNLTIQMFNEELQNTGLWSSEMEDFSNGLLKHRSTIIDIRNQYISHFGRKAAMENQVFNLGTKEDVAGFFEGLQGYCDSVGNALGVGPLDFRTSAGSGDAIDLLRRLKRA